MKIKVTELDTLVDIYFGQDYDLIDDSHEIMPKIDVYISSSSRAMKYALLDDIDLFISENSDINEAFQRKYSAHFIPELWGTTPRDFLLLVREKISQALRDEGPHRNKEHG